MVIKKRMEKNTITYQDQCFFFLDKFFGFFNKTNWANLRNLCFKSENLAFFIFGKQSPNK